MWQYIKNFIPRLFDSNDAKVQEHIVFTLIALVGGIALAWYDLTHTPGAHFDGQSYGAGMGIIMTGGGAAAWGKSKLTPPGGDLNVDK